MQPGSDDRRIEFRSVTHYVGKWVTRKALFQDIDAVFVGGANYVIFANRDAGGTTLLRLLSGLATPSRGEIRRYGSVSPPIGITAVPFYSRSIRQTAQLMARLYNVGTKELLDIVRLFVGPEDLDAELTTLSPATRTSLGYALGYAVPADFYVLNSVAPPNLKDDEGLMKLCARAFDVRRQIAGTIVVTSDVQNALDLGTKGGILHEGKLQLFDDIKEAASEYERLRLESDDSIIARIRALIVKGRINEARELMEASESQPLLASASKEALADLYFRAGHLDKAVEAARQAVEERPNSLARNLTLGRLAERQGSLEEAARAARAVLDIDPSHTVGRAMLARLSTRLGRYKEAVEAWRVLAENDAGASLRSLIDCQLKLGDFAGALSSIDRALAETGLDPDLLVKRAECLIEMGRADEILIIQKALLLREPSKAIHFLHKSFSRMPFVEAVGLAETLLVLKHVEPKDAGLISRTANFITRGASSANEEDGRRAKLLAQNLRELVASPADGDQVRP